MLGNGRKLVGAMLAFVCTGALAGSGFWSSNGPWGGVVYELHVPRGPSGATTAYASTRGGLFRTVDAGFSWERADSGVPGGLALGGALVIDDLSPGTLVGMDGRGRLHRSTDSAATWAPTGFNMDADLFATRLADVPGTSSELFLSAGSNSATPPAGSFLFRSTDAGNSFVAVAGGLPAGTSWNVVAVDPDGTGVVLVGTQARLTGTSGVASPPALYRSTDGGTNWTPVFSVPGLEDQTAEVTEIAFGAGATVYAQVEFALYRSDDGGANWTGPLFGSGHESLLPHPVAPLTLLSGGFGGVMISTDGGANATALNAGLTTNASYTSTLSGLPPAEAVATIAAESSWPAPGAALWVATNGGGVFRSTNDGASWSPVNTGIAATNVRAVAVHPNPSATNGAGQGTRIYAGFGDAFQGSPGMFLSINAGTTWGVSNNQLRASQIRAIAIDPTTAGLTSPEIGSSHIYAGGGAYQEDGYVNGGLYKSTNGGSTWTVLDGNLPVMEFGTTPWLGTVRNIVLDPRSCTIPLSPTPCITGPLLRVYATSTGHTVRDPVTNARHRTHRIIRSDDAGATWTALDADLPSSTNSGPPDFAFIEVTPLPLALSPTDPDVMYVGTFVNRNLAATTSGVDRESGVFRSADGGATWEQRSAGLPRVPGMTDMVVDVLAMAIHPSNDDILWAVTYDLQGGSAVPALHKTVDGGLSWSPSAAGLPMGIDLRALIVDPGDPDILYASGYYVSGDDGSGSFVNPPGVFRSDDGGATWLSISSGLDARSVLAMTLDPFQPHVLHLGTNTGVWSMEQLPDADGDGAPDAVENLAPNFGDGDGDGDADSTQGAVGSTIVIIGGGVSRAKGAQAGVTAKVSPLEGTCSQSVDVQALLSARYGRDYLPESLRYHLYPRDLVRFEVMDCKVAQVDLIFHGADFLGAEGWTFRMYGPSTPGDDATVGWHDLSARAEPMAPDRWRLTLDRDAMGSYRSTGTSILFMGGPACHDQRIFEDRLGDPVAPGCDD